MMNLLCALGVHRWGKWGDPEPHPLLAVFGYRFQSRRCATCNIVQSKCGMISLIELEEEGNDDLST